MSTELNQKQSEAKVHEMTHQELHAADISHEHRRDRRHSHTHKDEADNMHGSGPHRKKRQF